jgi:hypothetical protein
MDHIKQKLGPSRADKMEEFYAEVKDIPVEELLQGFQEIVVPAVKKAFEGDAELAGFNFDGFGQWAKENFPKIEDMQAVEGVPVVDQVLEAIGN